MRFLPFVATTAIVVVAAAWARAGEVSAQIVLDAELPQQLDREVLRAAVEAELGVAVVLAGPGVEGAGPVRVRVDGPGRVTISFRAEGGSEIVRPLDLPKDGSVAIQTIALIVVNLVRDQAGALLEVLETKPAPPAAEEKPATIAEKPVLAKPVAAPPPRLRAIGSCARPTFVAGADVLPYVGVGQEHVRAFSFGLLGTWSRGVRGLDLATVAATTDGDACGVQIGGATAIALGRVSGVQVGGAVALATGSVSGAQIGGAASIANGPVSGLQIGGAFTSAWAGLDGVAIAGAVALTGPMHGASIAPINVAREGVEGAQIGVVNVAAGDVHGAQIGVVNVARSSDAPIGVVSVVRNGRTHLSVWGDETGRGMLEFLHGGRYVHNLYGVGARVGPNGGARPALMLGLGFRALATSAVTVDVDATVTQLFRRDVYDTFVSQIRAVVAVRVFDRLEQGGIALLAGPTWSVMHSHADGESPQASVGVVELGDHVRAWPGVVFGLRAF